ncbi:Flp pilus assembly complex ATPase component TadA [Candidatus Berkelbacteria bacterium]|nr:Flp pilus assembly complex ATPase component TadA [Candidatus Berkelbacteria bacterium]
MADQGDLKDLNSITKAAKQLNLDVVRIDTSSPKPEALKLIKENLAREYRLVPLTFDGKNLLVALSDPNLLSKPAPAFLQDLKKKDVQLKLMLTPEADLKQALTAYQPQTVLTSTPEPSKAELKRDDSPISKPVTPKKAVEPAQQKVPATVNSQEIPIVDLTKLNIAKNALEKFPFEVARKYGMVVFELSDDGKQASVAVIKDRDPKVREILKFVEEKNGIRIKLYKTNQQSIDVALRGYGKKPITQANVSQDKKSISSNEQAPALKPSIKQAVNRPVQKPAVSQGEYSGAADYQKKVTTPKKAPVVEAQAPTKDEVATIKISDLQSQAGLSSPQKEENKDAAEGEGQNLDAILGESISNYALFERTVKSGLIPKIVASLVSYAGSLGSSDIHIEPGEELVRVRFRIDGRLREVIRLPLELLPPLVSRVKILSNLKIDETRLPQDGRFDVFVNGREIDLRVSTMPTALGEKVVMRLLDKSGGVKKLEELGLAATNLTRVTEALKKPYGIVLVTGPTGSGKSTTLSAMLGILNRDDVNIITLEDPVEYQIEGVNHTQVKPKIGYTFAEGLRSVLRQDPDIVMVGEIRDGETAGLATQAALTGHLVLSTLHTNNAAGAMPRLVDMEVEPFLIASSVNIVIAQRLVRKLCDQCKKETKPSPELVEELKREMESSVVPYIKSALSKEFVLYEAQGCAECQTGYKGRMGIYEVLNMSEQISRLTIKKASTDSIDEVALKEGMVSLKQDGIIKALEGKTSLDEVLQVTSSD